MGCHRSKGNLHKGTINVVDLVRHVFILHILIKYLSIYYTFLCCSSQLQQCENPSDKDTSPVACSGSGIIPSVSAVLPNQPQTSTPIHETSAKTTKPHYVVYADSELDMVRSQYFEMLCSGKDINCEMPKKLSCRLIKNTVTNMVVMQCDAVCQMVVMQCTSSLGKEVSYPSKRELRAMSKKIVAYYPCYVTLQMCHM